MALKNFVRSIDLKFLAAAAVAGGATCFATTASAWYSQSAGLGCPHDHQGSFFTYSCDFVSTSDHLPSSVTLVSVDVKVHDPTMVTICGTAFDGSYAGCTSPKAVPVTDGSPQTVTFATPDELSPWTAGDNRGTFVVVATQNSNLDEFLGFTVTAN